MRHVLHSHHRPVPSAVPWKLAFATLAAAAVWTTARAQGPPVISSSGAAPGIAWSTFIGGSGEDQAFGGFWGGQMHRGPDGTLTTWMITTSREPPFSASWGAGASDGAHDVVCARFSADGSRLLWMTRIGGPGDELGGSIAVDRSGDVYVGGHTFGGLPTTPGAHQRDYAGGNGDGFLARIGNDGRIKWLTYFGGPEADEIIGVALDPAGNVDITLGTRSDGLATGGAFCPNRYGDLIAQFDPRGALRWATYSEGAVLFGGICTDRNGDVLVTGSITSAELLATRCTAADGGRGDDVVVMRFSSSGGFRWASCLGGSKGDWAGGIEVAPQGAIIISGATMSPDLPVTPGAFQSRYSGDWDGFVGRLSANGDLEWLTYVGGRGEDWLGGLAVGATGQVTVVGRSGSPDLPITPRALQRELRGEYDGLIVRFDAAGGLLWSTYLGGLTPTDAYERIVALELDESGVIVFGSTSCPDFPTKPGSYQPVYGGGRRDCFLARLCLLAPKIAAASTAVCAGDSTELFATAGLTVRWNTGATTPSIIVRQPGRYWYEAIDGECSGWSDTVTVRLIAGPALQITPRGRVPLCGREPLELDAGEHAVYTWSTGATTRRIRVESPGVYRVTVRDLGACSASDSVEVLAPRPPVALSPSDPVICAGDSLLIEAPEGFLIYRWSNGSSARFVLARGGETLWAVLVDSTGCRRFTDTIRVRLVVPAPLAIDGPRTGWICEGDTATLASAPRAGYVWSTGATTQSIRAYEAGRYELETFDENGCHQRAVFELGVHPAPRPRIAPSGAVTLCAGDTLELAPGEHYAVVEWSDGTRAPRLRVSASGSYAARVIDSGGCDGVSDTVHVLVVPRPEVSLDGPTVACAGETVRFEVSTRPHVVYSWRTLNGTLLSNAVGEYALVQWPAEGPGVVIVEARDSTTGCVDTASHHLLVSRVQRPRVIAHGSTRMCAGDSVLLDAGGDYQSIRWSSGQTTRQIAVRESGRYSVTVRAPGGCITTSDTIVVSVDRPRTPQLSVEGDTLVATPALAHQWLRNGAVVAGATGSRHMPARNGSYAVRALDSNGCWGISVTRQVTFEASATVAVPELSARPGEVLGIQLVLLAAVNLPQVEAGAFTAVLRFRSRLLLPVEDSLSGEIQGSERIVTIRGQLREGDSNLAELAVTAALADTSATPITIDRFEWEGTAVTTTLRDGCFRIRPHGGWSALIDNGLLSIGEPVPNPARENVEVGYTLIEPGPTRLELYDPLGRRVAVLLDAYQIPGTFTVTHSVLGLPSGPYRLELTTPTRREGRTVCVAR